jgi:hypothetical protein
MPHDTEQLIGDYRSSKLSQAAFCKEKSIPMSTLQYHLHKSKAKAQPQMKEFLPILPAGSMQKIADTVIILHGNIRASQLAELIGKIA